jgi:pyruvate/2-oxoacid:ferredoxin oxidoreductase beta subunit
MMREAIAYPGFAFVHILAGCVTYQGPSYGESIYQRCDILPGEYDPTDLARALEAAQAERFALGVLYRRPAERAAGMGGGDPAAEAGIWPALGTPEAKRELPAD